MKKVTIGFSTPKKWNILSYLIKIMQKTEYSHVYIKFHSDSLDRDIIYQASGLQVNFVGYELFQHKHQVIKEYVLNVEDEAYIQALVFAVDNAGMPYSMKQLFHILAYMLFGTLKIFANSLSGYICSELVARLLNKLQIKIEQDFNIITPKDIDKLLEELYGKT